MNNLQQILGLLKTNQSSWQGEFFLPEAWNVFGFTDFTRRGCRSGEINVNPYAFMAFCLENPLFSTSGKPPAGRTDLVNNVIFSIFPRVFTAWDFSHSGEISSGTFLKTICMLPYLKRLNVDIIYLLPIFAVSDKYKKGELGSPYAIKNFYRLDPSLHDPLLGGKPEEMVDLEFKALVEACHLLGMRVMVDFVFRSAARDNDLIMEHPDWFYWIQGTYGRDFKVPGIPGEKDLILLNDHYQIKLYQSSDFKDYLAAARPSPREVDPLKWDRIVAQCKTTGTNLLDLIEAEYGITTVPGFSDVLNDPQPPWSDVTFLRFYFDMHPKARRLVSEERPPFILQDSISLNLYPGKIVNQELWSYIAGIIPYYQREFGIDGARIDMGHALPVELNQEIIARTKTCNPDFILWSEEFDVRKSKAARDGGFHFISGFTWGIYKDLVKRNFNRKLFAKTLAVSDLPIAASLETPDTPRFGFVYPEKRKVEFLIWVNSFLPNAVVILNNGLEIGERQPMNLGLDNTEAGRFVLADDDPFYGKLAFFDWYCLHWLNEDQEWIRQQFSIALKLRRQYADIISPAGNFLRQPEFDNNRRLTVISYYDSKSSRGLFLLGNRDFRREVDVNPALIFPVPLMPITNRITIIHSTSRIGRGPWGPNDLKTVDPGEVIIGYSGPQEGEI